MSLALNILIKNDKKNIEKTFKDYLKVFDKIYILDNNSTDGVIDYIFSLTNAKDKVKLVKEPSPITDFAKCRNKLLKLTKEDFVMWLDSDDEVSLGELLTLKSYLSENPETQALSMTYWYRYEGTTPLYTQTRERVLNTKFKWKWKGKIHEVCHCEDNINITPYTKLIVKHNRGHFVSDNENPSDRNFSLLSEIKNPTSFEIYYLMREGSSVLNAAGLELVFKSYEKSILKEKSLVAVNAYALFILKLVAEAQTNKLVQYLHKFEQFVTCCEIRSNLAVDALVKGYITLGELATALSWTDLYVDNPAETNTYSVDQTLYNGYKHLKKAEVYFKLGYIKNALEELFTCQASYYPTQEFVSLYTKLKTYCHQHSINLGYRIPETYTSNNHFIELTISLNVLQNCDFSEFSTEACVMFSEKAEHFINVLHNSKIKMEYLVPTEQKTKLLPWQQERFSYNWYTPITLGQDCRESSFVLDLKGKLGAYFGTQALFDACTSTRDYETWYLVDSALTKTNSKPKYVTTDHPTVETVTVVPTKNRQVIFVASGMQPWNGGTPKTEGIGASESSLVWLAEELVRQGYSVSVYCTTEYPMTFGGVSYYPTTKFSPLVVGKKDVLISSRLPEILNTRMCDTQILWLHDDPKTSFQQLFDIKEVDKIVCVSESHKKRLLENAPFLEKEKITFIYNIVPNFPSSGESTRVFGRAVSLSSPDRATFNWIKLKPEEITETFILYGWTNYQVNESLIEKSLKEKYQLRKAGFYVIGKIPKLQLLEFLHTCEYMPYFSDFFETFCVAAVEAIMCGVKVMTNNNSAILEVSSKMQDTFEMFNYIPETTENLQKCPDILRQAFNNSMEPNVTDTKFGYNLVREWELLF